MRNIEKNYYQFTPHERINLAMAALARDDIEELDRLRRTCKTYTYTARDLNYQTRMTSITLISCLFFEKVIHHYNNIMLFELYSRDLLLCMSLSDSETDISSDQIDELIETIVSKKHNHISFLKGVYTALKIFCEEVNLISEDIIKSINFEKSCEKINDYLSSEIKANDEYAQFIKNELLKFWQHN